MNHHWTGEFLRRIHQNKKTENPPRSRSCDGGDLLAGAPWVCCVGRTPFFRETLGWWFNDWWMLVHGYSMVSHGYWWLSMVYWWFFMVIESTIWLLVNVSECGLIYCWAQNQTFARRLCFLARYGPSFSPRVNIRFCEHCWNPHHLTSFHPSIRSPTFNADTARKRGVRKGVETRRTLGSLRGSRVTWRCRARRRHGRCVG